MFPLMLRVLLVRLFIAAGTGRPLLLLLAAGTRVDIPQVHVYHVLVSGIRNFVARWQMAFYICCHNIGARYLSRLHPFQCSIGLFDTDWLNVSAGGQEVEDGWILNFEQKNGLCVQQKITGGCFSDRVPSRSQLVHLRVKNKMKIRVTCCSLAVLC